MCPPPESASARLAGGDRRSTGEADAIAAEACSRPGLIDELWTALHAEDAVVRMRAADALEKVSRRDPALLEPYRRALVAGSAEDGTAEVRWNLAAILPRLSLTLAEARQVMPRLTDGLWNDRSRIARAVALETLVGLAAHHEALADEAARTVAACLNDPTPSLRARARRHGERREWRCRRTGLPPRC